jgi:hypothetical protein
VFAKINEIRIERLEFSCRYGTEAHMKRRPVQVKADRPTICDRSPQTPGAFRKRNAAKCIAIINQPVSQIFET